MVTRLKQPHVSNSSTESSSEAVNSLNGVTGPRDYTQRRLNKPKSNSGASLVSQRSIPLRPNPLRRDTSYDTSAISSANDPDEEQSTAPNSSLNDVSREKSTSEIWASVPRPTLRAFYKLNNPLGPRWYRNYHLIPPSHLKPSMRPPTFFSPSFPPIGTTSPDHYDDEELSGSPSHSPLPTPDSSQTRVQDSSKPRSRKTSQTAPDAIDLLDLSDPWGQNWHHKSPYEFGNTTIMASLDTTDLPNRTRCASFSVSHARQRSVAPSPLSQSTSAVNLPSLQPEIKHPRKLSKRKTTNVATIFTNSPPKVDRKASSVPATPIDSPLASDTLPKRMSIAPAGPFMTVPSPTPKREKRGSLLNRLVKKFSTLKRGSEPILGGVEGWSYEASSSSLGHRQSSSVAANTLAFPEKPLVNGGDLSGDDDKPAPRQEDDRASFSSLEISYSVMRKLTVVNPDPSDEENEPVAAESPNRTTSPELDKEVSPEDDHISALESHEPVHEDSLAFLSDPVPETSVDKPLPPRLGTPRFSGLVMSEIMVSTPQVTEQPLPPLPPKDIIPQESPSSDHEAMSLPPSPALPAEPPELLEHPSLSAIDDPFHIVNSISLDHTTHEPPLPPKTQAIPENLKQTPSRRKSASPPREASQKPVVERRDTRSPTAVMVVRREPPQSSSGRQPSIRNPAPPPEVSPMTERKNGSLRSTNGQASFSTRDLADFKSPPSRTESRSNSRPETRVPAAVPQFLEPSPVSTEESRPLEAHSPLSTTSILANPPTPYDHRISINVSDVSEIPPALPPKSVRHQSPPPSRTTGTSMRRTETFKLVRSSSGNVYAPGQTILAQGQQWEIVESPEIPKKDTSLRMKAKSKGHGRERELSGEREREKARETERELEREREKEKEKQRAREKELEREKQRAREREIELQKERAREEKRESERIQREMELQREKERAKEKERREAERLKRELELQREWERAREWERREAERQREREKERERERERIRREREKQREKEREREHRERERQREKEREREREKEKERDRRKERERRERERVKERERERRRDREREGRERKERERERERRDERNPEEDPYRERRSGNYDRKSRDYDRKSREYEPRGRDHDSRMDSSGYKSRDEGRSREPEYDHSSKKESRHYETPRQSRKPDGQHDRIPTRHPAEISYSQPEPAVQAVQMPEPHPVRRMPSVGPRPTSQLPSADEMNAIRAKEQWEMERLWKARSLHGLEPNAMNHIIPGHSSNSSLSDDIPEIDPSSAPQNHGSSHTAYLVQSPFHDSRPQIYHSMPTALPPIYYHSPASIPSIPDSLSTYEPYENLRFYPGPAQVAESFPIKSNNPLPEPPRESPYKPAPLSSISKRRSTEYWTLNGINTTH